MKRASLPLRRRDFLSFAGGAALWPLAAGAQQAKIPRVGVIWIGSPQRESVVLGALRQALADRGYILGRDLLFDERYAEGKEDRIPTLIADLLTVGVDVLVTPGSSATFAAHQATTTVPIVSVGPIVADGLAASLARPGGNVTGIDNQANDYRVKWLELLKAVTPKLDVVAILSDPDETPAVMRLKETAARFGLTLTFLPAKSPDLDSSLAAVASRRFDGLIVNDNPSLLPQIPRIVALVAESRTPTLYGFSIAARQGGLIGYSANFVEVGRRLAYYVEKILKGARAGDLPIEQPTAFVLSINLKTAKALSLDIPPTLLAAADEVVE
jgi:putative tryptophan/tyrosine transport system substrate-binding protein